MVKVTAFDLFGKIRFLYGNAIIEDNLSSDLKGNRSVSHKIAVSSYKSEKIKKL